MSPIAAPPDCSTMIAAQYLACLCWVSPPGSSPHLHVA